MLRDGGDQPRPVNCSTDLDREIGRHGIDKNKIALAQRRDGNAIEDYDVVRFLWPRRIRLPSRCGCELDVGKETKEILQEGIAWTDVQDADHGGFVDREISPVIGRKIVIDLQPGL